MSFAALLLGLNLWIVWRMFWIDYTIHMGSVEGTFIAIARYTRNHWGHLGWWPLWFCGMPYENTYQPLLHTVVAAVSWLTGVNAGRAYHVVLGMAYALGPVTLFALAARLTGHLGRSLIAGLAYSLFSPSSALISSLRTDTGSAFFARRLTNAVVWADGPHVVALTLIPLALLAIHRALDTRSVPRFLLASLAIAAVILTNIPGTIALFMALAAYAMVYCTDLWKWMRLIGMVTVAWGLSLLWVPPSTLVTVLSNTQWMEPSGRWDATRVLWVGGLGATAFLVASILKRRGVSQAIQFAAIFTLISGAVVLGVFWANVTIVAQPKRFHTAFEMALTCAVVFVVAEILVRWRTAVVVACVVVGCLAVVQIGNFRTSARKLLRPVDMQQRSEYKVARWLDEHANGARVLAPGSIAFWLNAFTDTPQMTGCCDQGVLLRPIKMAYYEIGTDDGAGDHAADISTTWMEALGVRYVVVSGPNSTEVFKDFKHPLKFQGWLREAWRDGDDVIYEVPQRTPGFAHVVRRDELVGKIPENGVLLEPLRMYVAAIEDPNRPVPAVVWRNAQEATIRARFAPGDVISLQIPRHFGWHAVVNGQSRAISADALGFMVIDPGCTGECEISLTFDGGSERTILRGAGGVFGLVLVFWWVRRRRQRLMK